MEAYAIFTSTVTAACAVGGVLIAAGGLRTWRRQLHGQVEYDLARRTLREVYRTRDAIRQVRAAWMYGSEYADRPGRDPQVVHHADDVAYAYQARLNKLFAVTSDLQVNLLEAEVLWGELLASPRTHLIQLTNELSLSIGEHVDMMRTQARYTKEELSKIRAIVFMLSDTDPFSLRVTEVVREFENALRPHLDPFPLKRRLHKTAAHAGAELRRARDRLLAD
jgi:hypothetical protein